MSDPIDRVTWVPATSLRPNAYNPNVVLTPELRLLAHSLLATGWLQPILVDPDGNIIDGFHRWRLSQDTPELRDRYLGQVPVVVLHLSPAEVRLLTVRINRAKGSHVALRMAELVKELVDDLGMTVPDIAKGIGATNAEVEMLYGETVFKALKVHETPYSKAWVPRESRTG